MPHPDALDTPCVLIDLDKVERNLGRAQKHFDRQGIPLRPHIKTHKLPRFARMQLELGAIGITCQKVGEAEVMAEAGLSDIMLPYNILGAQKLDRLKVLSRKVNLTLCADSAETVAGYAQAFEKAREPISVLVECDTGAGRCGVQSPQAAVALARLITQHKGLHFAGLMTYPPQGKSAEALVWLREAVATLSELGLKPDIVSTGGTPDMWLDWPKDLITEYRPGTYIYMDRSLVSAGAATFDDCALTVLATVVSRPTDKRFIIDAGSKALTSDLLGQVGYGHIPEFPHAIITTLSEEHGIVDLPSPSARPQIGAQIEIVPNHACPVSNLYDWVHLTRRGRAVDRVDVAARGKLS